MLLSQDNITWIIQASQDVFHWNYDREVCVSYLPLSHVAAQIIDIYLCFFGGATVWFADKTALQGTLVDTLLEARPTRFIGVPRVYEKMNERLVEVGTQARGLRKMVADWAKAQASSHHLSVMAGAGGGGLSYKLARRLILSQVHRRLGLDRAAHPTQGGLYSGASPLSLHTFHYFLSLDLPIMELLGSSETTGPQAASTPGVGCRPGSVGRSFPHFQTIIENQAGGSQGKIFGSVKKSLQFYWRNRFTKRRIFYLHKS